ncbi:inner-membrane translocator [Halobacillus halophilus]|uniref:inner-membrane translocator n=1 Tax=Halobacillus halophilus TaxID=1570 RepID=UPI001CD3E940|nr:inner-membrane translocator [Halobacillus halophilus]MCA1011695.1 inner-membrane translocator [Halobacillus halophilus]
MDALMYLFLAALLIPSNIFIIIWQKSGQFPLWSSGVLLAVLGIGIGFVVGAILIGPGNAGQGGAIMSAFVGLVIIANGLIYVFIGLVLVIGKLFTKKNTPG